MGYKWAWQKPHLIGTGTCWFQAPFFHFYFDATLMGLLYVIIYTTGYSCNSLGIYIIK
ncbi:hypothetical protein HanPSC8_Chr00c385g0808121 [Helianthus annuus]|nr:hypothetical protein HanPSC8_Chr00c385g0808121 [Helianthus annuus]